MTTIFTRAAEEVEAGWNQVETVADADIQIIATAAKGFFTSVAPKLLSVMLELANDAAVDFVTNPASAMTTLLGQIEAAAVAEWQVLKPEAQTALLNTVGSMVTVTAQAGGISPPPLTGATGAAPTA